VLLLRHVHFRTLMKWLQLLHKHNQLTSDGKVEALDDQRRHVAISGDGHADGSCGDER